MAERKTPAQDAVQVEGLQTASGQKVVAVPPKEDVTPPPAQPEPEQAAKPASGTEEVVANIGHVRVKTTAEKRIEGETAGTEDHWLRDAKEAHRDAAKLSVMATVGTELTTNDVRGTAAEDANQIVRARLLFAWVDGQGVPHEMGKELDLPRNEAVKLVEEGRAERATPPEADPIEQAMADARMAVLTEAKKR